MKVEITGGETVEEEFEPGIYKDRDNELWLINEEQDAISLNESSYSKSDFEALCAEFGPLTYFTGTVTFTND